MNTPKDVQDMSAVFNYMKKKQCEVITLETLGNVLPQINYQLTPTHVHKKSMQRLVLIGDRIFLSSTNTQSTPPPVVETYISPNIVVQRRNEVGLSSSELINEASKMNSCYDKIQSIASTRTTSYVSMHFGFGKSNSDSKLSDLELICICLDNPERVTYVIDVKEVKTKKLLAVLQLVLKNFTVIFYDGRKASDYLSKHYSLQIGKVISVKLLFECVTGEAMATFEQIVSKTGVVKPLKMDQTRKNGVVKRPLTTNQVHDSVEYIKHLMEAFKQLLSSGPSESSMVESTLRFFQFSCDESEHLMVFDVKKNYRLISKALVPVGSDSGVQNVDVFLNVDDIFDILPNHYAAAMKMKKLSEVRDLIIDVKLRPRIFYSNGNEFLFDDESEVVKEEDLQALVSNCKFGTDNRALLNSSLHRISCMRNLEGEVYGLTIRFGRYISGLASIFSDLIFSDSSILLLGPPGTGKSSIIRDVTRMLSSNDYHTVIVDTSNEIAGNGDIVHPSVGLARRLMVPSLEQQKSVMIEAVQNHTPDVIVIDEIGRKQEVDAAATIKRRGVRLMATAHGTFIDLVKNPQMRGLCGGFQQVTLSDKEAKGLDGEMRKTRTERCGEPIFDVIIELSRTKFTYRIIKPVSVAVDRYIQNQPIEYEIRRNVNNEIIVSYQQE